MKILAIILSVFIVTFTTKPLLSHVVQLEQISKTETAQGCCGHCSGECCGDQSEDTDNDACDTSAHDCTQDCTCVMDGFVVFTSAPSPQIHLFETILDKIETRYISYEFTLPVTIWHPPQKV